jgi:hypothetical protein
MLLLTVDLPPVQIQLQTVDTTADSSRDEFPQRRCAPHPSGRGLSCTEVVPGNPYQVIKAWLGRS